MQAVKPLAQVQLGVGLTVIYSGLPGGTAPILTRCSSLWICNTDSADHTFTLRFWLTGALTAVNSLVEAQSIKANTPFYFHFHEDGLPILTGYTLYGLADVGAKITATLFGAEEV